MLFEISDKAEKEISKYCDDYEIYIEKEKVFEFDAQKNNIEFIKEEINLGIGIRVITGNKLGFAYTSDLEKIEDLAQKAYSNGKLNEKDENFAFGEKSKLAKVKGVFDSKFENLDIEECADFLKSIIATCEEEQCEPTSGGFSAGFQERLIVNSNGVSANSKSTGFSSFIAVNAEKDGEKSTAYDGVSSCLFNLDGEKLAKETCQIAKDSIGGVNIDTGDMNVVLDYHAGVGLLSTFINGFNADNVQRGRSVLQDKIGDRIVDNNLSIYDDGTFVGGLNSGACDSEGTPSKKTVLVKDGVLNSFIYDMYTAKKANDEDTVSTSNGFRGSYASTPSVSPSNVIFDFNEKISISEIDNGFLATDVLGAHTANPISGDFSVEANNAFLIEGGEITKPVKKAMISGNIFNALTNCEGVKSEIKQYGSCIIPKILCKDLRVIA